MSQASGAGRRPNVVVFIADQLRADHLGFAGNPVVKTPHLDRLAAASVVFTEATVANPTCMPNRASLLTGRWPSAHGTRCNGITMDPNASTMVRNMALDGYNTAAVGKLHHQNMGWPFEDDQRAEIEATDPLLLSLNHRDAAEFDREPGWDRWENRSDHEAGFLQLPKDYYGYQHVDLVVGHGDNPGGHYRHWAAGRGWDPRRLGGAGNAVTVYPGWEQVYETAVPVEAHPSSYVADKAIERIGALAGEDEPFFLFVSFPDPHHPFSPPAGYADLYSPEDIPLPAGFHQDHSKSPEHIRALIDHRGTPGSDSTMTWSVTEDQYRHAAAAQYGLITLMDEQIGRVLGALSAQGLDDDTVVLFTSDHGDLLGDHGLMLKHFTHYRAVTNVPLTIRVPGTAPRSTAALVSTADLAPTLLELTGTAAFRGLQGQSLVPLLEGSVDAVREALIIEEDQPFGLPGLPAPVRIRSVLTRRARLTRYFGTAAATELYDLLSDPDELDNLADDTGHAQLLGQLTELMLEETMALGVMGTRPTASA
ncbi:sulfatase [Arthrobacter sp. STN4]|uniref:sulfatase family protein n=1 Tax=Arthrobacter sp. STN4 TaxID=2923276 RepID=UPI00211A7ECD|nr:sulfatase-like hydrolase/transferase [Arthrobacter sp. STN4]MCQ9162831.1 sulfatase-like hydrolase/transferase [Arthrobacter sp. STN4]